MVQLQVLWMMHPAISSVIHALQPAASDAAPRATWQARAFSVDNRILFARRYANVSTDREVNSYIPHKFYMQYHSTMLR